MRWLAWCLLATTLLGGQAQAMPVRSGRVAIGGRGPSVGSVYDLPAGPDGYLAVAVSIPGNGLDIVSVTWAQAPLARIASQTTPGGQCRAEVWGLVGPVAGSHVVTVTTSAATVIEGAAVSYLGVDPIASTGGWRWTTGTGGSASVSLTTAAGELVLDSLCVGGPSSSIGSASVAQTEIWRITSALDLAAAGSDRAAAMGSSTMSWTVGTGSGVSWAMAAVSLRPSGAVVFLDAGVDAPAGADAGSDASAPLQMDGAAPLAEPPADAARSADSSMVADAAAPPTTADAASDPSGGPRAVTAELGVGCACQLGRTPSPGVALLVPTLALLRLVSRMRRPRRRGPLAGEGACYRRRR
jgi:hypothetical protein